MRDSDDRVWDSCYPQGINSAAFSDIGGYLIDGGLGGFGPGAFDGRIVQGTGRGPSVQQSVAVGVEQ